VTAASRLRGAGAAELAFLAVTLALAGIHLYLGLFEPSVPSGRTIQFLLIGVAFLAGVFVWLSPLWQSVLYLLGVAFVFFLGAIWLLGGIEPFAFGLAAGLAAVAFVGLAVALFVRGESQAGGW
jgi:hypothetical protein